MKYCSHCGAQLPDSAKFCTECGTALAKIVEVKQQGTLRVSRQSAMMASAMKTKIYVDGELKNTVANGQSVSFLLDPGNHRLELSTPANGSIDRTITISPGVETVITFKLSMLASGCHDVLGISDQFQQEPTRQAPVIIQAPSQQSPHRGGRVCPKCGGEMAIQTVSESRKAGCLTIILYLLLALTILGLLIVIPLVLRKKTETVTYVVCQKCGYKKVISRS